MRTGTSKSTAAFSSPTSRIKVGRSIASYDPRTVDLLSRPLQLPVHKKWTGVNNQRFKIPCVDYKKEIGRRIRSARDERGWTLAELSRETNDVLSRTRIGNYETGERTPGPAEALVLAGALKVRAAYIMGVDDVQLHITTQEEALIRNWRTLPENQRMQYFRQLEQMAMAHRDPVTDARVEKHYPATPKERRKAKR